MTLFEPFNFYFVLWVFIYNSFLTRNSNDLILNYIQIYSILYLILLYLRSLWQYKMIIILPQYIILRECLFLQGFISIFNKFLQGWMLFVTLCLCSPKKIRPISEPFCGPFLTNIRLFKEIVIGWRRDYLGLLEANMFLNIKKC